MNVEMDKVMETAKTFRRLGEMYEEIQGANNEPNIISQQMFIMSDVLNNCCGAKLKSLGVTKKEENAILKTMLSKGVKVKDIRMYERNSCRKEIIMQAKTKHGCIRTKDIASELSNCIDYDFISCDNNRSIINDEYNEYTFLQEPRFRILFGIARRNKDNMEVSGDNFSLKELDCGRVIVTIADGMGTGKRAYCESETVVDLMEQCLEAGFEEKMAIGLINSVFSIGKSISNPIALDMCVIDRWLGVLNCIKLGAASTFIKRDGWVEIIKSTTLPIGVLEQVDYDNSVKKLYDDDYIIMVSDGVLENLPTIDKEKMLVDIISEVDVKEPNSIAQKIMEKALECNEMIAKDDMTIIVLGTFDTYLKVY